MPFLHTFGGLGGTKSYSKAHKAALSSTTTRTTKQTKTKNKKKKEKKNQTTKQPPTQKREKKNTKIIVYFHLSVTIGKKNSDEASRSIC